MKMSSEPAYASSVTPSSWGVAAIAIASLFIAPAGLDGAQQRGGLSLS